jgi:high-affinity Fe2+/Pb2+ permease
LKKDVIEDAKKKLRNVKILLIVLAGLNILFGLYYLMEDYTFYDGLAGLITAFVFIGCALWVEKQPLTGILAGFGFWILLQLVAIFINPANIFSGIILKVIFIVIFVKGIASAKDAKVFTEQLKEMKAI